jgi:IclR family acetate operon transcriptional repressor
VQYVDKVFGHQAARSPSRIGSRLPASCTAVGKALLALSADDDVRALLERTGLPRHTPHTVVDADDFLEQIAQVRSRGYALDEGEQEVGVRCIGVALPGDRLRAAVSVSAPVGRMTDALAAAAVPLLQTAAHQLADDLASAALPD